MNKYIDLFEVVACQHIYQMRAGVNAVVKLAQKDMQKELDAANAHIAELKKLVDMALSSAQDNYACGEDLVDYVKGSLQKTPAQSLSSIEAKAIRDATAATTHIINGQYCQIHGCTELDLLTYAMSLENPS